MTKRKSVFIDYSLCPRCGDKLQKNADVLRCIRCACVPRFEVSEYGRFEGDPPIESGRIMPTFDPGDK